MPWRTAPAWPERPPPLTVATTSYWPRALGDVEHLVDDQAQRRAGEIDLLVAAVDDDLAGAGLQPDAGDRVLAAAGGVGAALLVELLLAQDRLDLRALGRRRPCRPRLPRRPRRPSSRPARAGASAARSLGGGLGLGLGRLQRRRPRRRRPRRRAPRLGSVSSARSESD